jgi:hypothetical protein
MSNMNIECQIDNTNELSQNQMDYWLPMVKNLLQSLEEKHVFSIGLYNSNLVTNNICD